MNSLLFSLSLYLYKISFFHIDSYVSVHYMLKMMKHRFISAGSYNFWLPQIAPTLQKAEATVIKFTCEIFLRKKPRNLSINSVIM